MKKSVSTLFFLTLGLVGLVGCAGFSDAGLETLASQMAQQALYPSPNLVEHPLPAGVRVVQTQVSPRRTVVRLETSQPIISPEAYLEATDRVIAALSKVLAGKVKRLEFAFEGITAQSQEVQSQAFPCSGAARVIYPDPRPKPTRLAETKVVLNPGHGYTQKDSGSWVYQRPIPPLEGAYMHEDPNNLEVAQVVNSALIAEGATLFSARNLDKNGGNGVSGQPRWVEAARHHVQALGVPDHVWNSEGNALSGDCNLGRDIRVRPFYANQVQADVLIGLHSNAIADSSVRGTWILFNTAAWEYTVPGITRTNSALLAHAIGDAVVVAIRQARPELNWPDPVYKDSLDYGEINFAMMPAVILEVGFHTNPGDSAAMVQDSFRQAVAKGIRDGLKTYLGDTSPPPWLFPHPWPLPCLRVGGCCSPGPM